MILRWGSIRDRGKKKRIKDDWAHLSASIERWELPRIRGPQYGPKIMGSLIQEPQKTTQDHRGTQQRDPSKRLHNLRLPRILAHGVLLHEPPNFSAGDLFRGLTWLFLASWGALLKGIGAPLKGLGVDGRQA